MSPYELQDQFYIFELSNTLRERQIKLKFLLELLYLIVLNTAGDLGHSVYYILTYINIIAL